MELLAQKQRNLRMMSQKTEETSCQLLRNPKNYLEKKNCQICINNLENKLKKLEKKKREKSKKENLRVKELNRNFQEVKMGHLQ
jgi:copper chaperone CopZ